MTTPEALGEAVHARLLDFGVGLPPSLRGAFEALHARLLGDKARACWSDYFMGTQALPVLELPWWMLELACRDGRTTRPEALLDLVESAATGYLAVRVQDDFLDEGRGEPAAVLMLSGTLMLRHQTLLHGLVGDDPRFRALNQRAWDAYHEAMLLEASLLRSPGEVPVVEARVINGRFKPLGVPPAAALLFVGLDQHLPDLERLVDALSEAHQLMHDLLDAERDQQEGRFTPLVRRFHGHGSRTALRRGLYLEGGFDAVVDEALAHLREARAAASRLRCPEALAFLAKREAWLLEVQQQVFARVFAHLLREEPEDAPDPAERSTGPDRGGPTP